jgi:predicted RNase H-like HicB family nuclease
VAIVYYPAIIERSRSGFGVFFPDLPGCTSAGGTLVDAAANAEEALAGHVLAAEAAGESIPEPGDIEAIERDPDVDEAARILVKLERS